MQHFIKQFRRFSWVMALFTLSTFFYACNEEVKKEAPKEEAPAVQAPSSTTDTIKKAPDSLPPVDKKAGTRPEDAGT